MLSLTTGALRAVAHCSDLSQPAAAGFLCPTVAGLCPGRMCQAEVPASSRLDVRKLGGATGVKGDPTAQPHTLIRSSLIRLGQGT